MNRIIRTLFFITLLFIPAFINAQVTNVDDAPQDQVKKITSKATAFSDAMYAKMDWKQFEKFEAAQKPIDYLDIDYGLLDAAIFYYTNKYRESLKLPTLAFSPQLRDAAIYHSLEMVNRKFYDHMNPHNKTMHTPKDRILNFSFSAANLGENIDVQYEFNYKAGKQFWGEPDGKHFKYHYGNSLDNKGEIPAYTYSQLAEIMVKAWINSPPHRENLQNKNFRYMGCGAIGDFRGGTATELPQAYSTQDFGG